MVNHNKISITINVPKYHLENFGMAKCSLDAIGESACCVFVQSACLWKEVQVGDLMTHVGGCWSATLAFPVFGQNATAEQHTTHSSNHALAKD